MPVEPPHSKPPTDEQLRQRLVYGDGSALSDAYDAYGPLVTRVALRVTRSPSAAEDIAQEVFTQLWTRPYAFDPDRGSLRTWLSMLAHRRAVDWVRSEERHRKAARALAVVHTEEVQENPDAERALMLHSALAELPLPQRQVVHLSYFAGRTYRQAAAELGIPEGTAKSRLRAALHRLATMLAEPPDPAIEEGV
ncbi:sigma-70 family RNA polymerase sigma factor [Streptomyces sp. NBC_01465]|nr:sigma-70 family RNA polymerase sigma factor [Streptomyces sp. NBC_01465]